MQEELLSVSDIVSVQSKRNAIGKSKVNTLAKELSDKDAETNRLKYIIGKYKAIHPNYIPVKDDPIDQALAEYVNSLDEPLDVQFVREDTGIYTYGSKRVFIKIEQGKIIIRVGGGYMTVDEFIQMFTVQELERLASKAKQTKDPHRASVYSKFKDTLPPSPRTHDMSQFRASKIIRDDSSKGFTTAYGITRRPGTPSKPSPSPMPTRKRHNSVSKLN